MKIQGRGGVAELREMEKPQLGMVGAKVNNNILGSVRINFKKSTDRRNGLDGIPAFIAHKRGVPCGLP